MSAQLPSVGKLRVDSRSLSAAQSEALEPIGKRIRACWDEANCQAARARSAGAEAVKSALLCGEALLEAKGLLRHGQWLPWLERHCASVARSMVTAQHWMRLAAANKKGGFYLEEARSLTEAYRMVGILPALPAAERAEAREMTIDVLVARLSPLRSALRAVKGWTVEQRRRLAEEMRPLVELYHELIPEAAA